MAREYVITPMKFSYDTCLLDVFYSRNIDIKNLLIFLDRIITKNKNYGVLNIELRRLMTKFPNLTEEQINRAKSIITSIYSITLRIC